jgi:hypothetical protein
MRTVINIDSAPGRRSIDALLERYVCWREESEAVWQAYEGWNDSDCGEREPAYAGYLAALDREELAARAYAHQIGRVRRMASSLAT